MRLGDRLARRNRIGVKRQARRHQRGVVDRAIVAVPDPPPVTVADGIFDGGAGLAQEFFLVLPKVFQHLAKDGGGTFADPDRADL